MRRNCCVFNSEPQQIVLSLCSSAASLRACLERRTRARSYLPLGTSKELGKKKCTPRVFLHAQTLTLESPRTTRRDSLQRNSRCCLQIGFALGELLPLRSGKTVTETAQAGLARTFPGHQLQGKLYLGVADARYREERWRRGR